MIQNFVKLEPISHTYQDTNGKPYASVSKVLDSLEEPFDVEMMSRNCAGKGKYVGMTQQQVKDQWAETAKEANDHGTRIHESLERYTKKFEILKSDQDLAPMIQEVCKDYIEYKKVYDEICLYSAKYGVAGTADKILVTKAKSGIVDIEDYKTNIKKGIYYFSEYNKYMKGPVSHLQQCNFNRYAMQMSLYGVMYEELTGHKVRSLWIRFIAPITYKPERIPVPYMRTDAIAVLEHFYNSNNITILANSNYTDVPTFD